MVLSTYRKNGVGLKLGRNGMLANDDGLESSKKTVVEMSSLKLQWSET